MYVEGNMNINYNIGERIKNRRLELKKTQLQIFEETGISSGNMSSFENGKTLPSANALIELAKALECSIDYLLVGNTYFSKQNDPIYLSNKEQTLLTEFEQLKPDDQDEIFALIDLKIKRNQKKSDPQKGIIA